MNATRSRSRTPARTPPHAAPTTSNHAARTSTSNRGSFQLTGGGLRDLGKFPTFSKAANRAAQLVNRQFLDMALWGPEGELLAVFKDGEMIAVAAVYRTTDDGDGYGDGTSHDDGTSSGGSSNGGYLDLDALERARVERHEPRDSRHATDDAIVDLDALL